jgi:hypothetical protein
MYGGTTTRTHNKPLLNLWGSAILPTQPQIRQIRTSVAQSSGTVVGPSNGGRNAQTMPGDTAAQQKNSSAAGTQCMRCREHGTWA